LLQKGGNPQGGPGGGRFAHSLTLFQKSSEVFLVSEGRLGKTLRYQSFTKKGNVKVQRRKKGDSTHGKKLGGKRGAASTGKRRLSQKKNEKMMVIGAQYNGRSLEKGGSAKCGMNSFLEEEGELDI